MVGKAGGAVSVGVAPTGVAGCRAVAVACARLIRGKLQFAATKVTKNMNIVNNLRLWFTGHLLRL